MAASGLMDTATEDRKKQDDDALALAIAFWNLHSQPSDRGLLIGDGWTWDELAQEYRSDTGARLTQSDMRDIAHHMARSAGESNRRDTQDMLDGKISVDEWHRRIEDRTEGEYWALAALACGGLDELTEEEGRAVWGNGTKSGLDYSIDRLKAFKDEVEAGEAGTAKQIVNRAGQYGDSGYSVNQEAARASHSRMSGATGIKILERSNLNYLAEHCSNSAHAEGCIEVAAAGLQPIGTLPRIGERTCGGKCLCYWTFESVPSGS
jgi:hypothetical protein